MNEKKRASLLSIYLCLLFFLIPFSTTIASAESNPNKSVSEWFEQQNGEREGIVEDDGLPPETETDNNTVGITFWDVIKSIFSLLFVLILLVLLLKWMQKKNGRLPTSQLIQPLGGMNLGGNRSVQIIKFGQKLYMIGVGENVQLLKEIDEEKEIEGIIALYDGQRTPFAEGSDLFGKIMNRLKGKTTDNKPISSFKQEMQDQFDRMLKERKERMGGRRREDPDHE